MSLIPITGVPSTYLVPGFYQEINFATGPSNAAAGPRDAVLVMPKTSAGSWQANQLIEVGSEQELIDGAGPGSMAHRAGRLHLKANRTGKLYCVVYNESSGVGAASADGYIGLSGTATASGLLTVTVCGEVIQLAVNKDATGSTLGTMLEAAINAKTHLPCTASNAGGSVTLTAKIDGKSQGDGTTGVIRFRASVKSGIGISVSVSGAALGLGFGNPGVDGSTTEASNLETALATIETKRKYYIGVSVWDATALSETQIHVANKSLPVSGRRSVAIAAFTGSLAAAQTLATARNYERLQLAWQRNSEHDVAELVGNVLAVRQKRESFDPRAGVLVGYRNSSDWFIKPVYDAADAPDADDLNDALTDGIAPIATDDVGSYLVDSVTTRSKDPGGTVDDRRASSTHTISVADDTGDTLGQRWPVQFGGLALKDDERLQDGSVNFNQKRVPGVVTPSQVKPWVGSVLREKSDAGYIQDLDASIAGMACNVDPNDVSRLEIGFDLRCIDLMKRVTVRINEVTPG